MLQSLIILQNQEARTVRRIGSLVFDCPLRQGCEEGVEVRSLLSTDQLEERDGCTVVTVIGPDGTRYVDATVVRHHDEADIQQVLEGQSITDPMCSRRAPPTTETPIFGDQCPLPELRTASKQCSWTKSCRANPTVWRTQIPCVRFLTGSPLIHLTGAPPQPHRVPPEDQVPSGCSVLSMEPLREWFCRAADMTSPLDIEAAISQFERDPPHIRDINDNIRVNQLRTRKR